MLKMIFYRYDEEDKTLTIKIFLTIPAISKKPTEEKLRKALPEILRKYAEIVESGKEKIVDSEEWGIW